MKFKEEYDDNDTHKKRGNKHRARKRKGVDKRDLGYFDADAPEENDNRGNFKGEFKGEF